MFFNALRQYAFGIVLLVSLIGCDSGGSNTKPGSNPQNTPVWRLNQYSPSESLYGYCANPRTGIDPTTGRAYFDKPGTLMHEKLWARSFMRELYLWSGQASDLSPASYNSAASYFDSLKVRHDRYSYTMPTEASLQEYSGIQVGYGISWAFEWQNGRPVIRVADVQSNSPHYGVLSRGDTLTEVDGINIANLSFADAELVDQALYPTEAQEVHSANFLILATGAQLVLELIAEEISSPTVPRYHSLATDSGSVGYLQFNRHLEKSEQELFDAVTALYNQGVEDLVLDLRYNWGGYLDIASQLAFMIAGPGRTTGADFFKPTFNPRWGDTNPFTGQPVESMLFHETTVFGESTANLPSLHLGRVFVLIGGSTCSASEALINGLKGIGVQVYLFGSETCGKPFGWVDVDNCGTTYSMVMFKGANHLGYGDYTNGFSASGSAMELDASVLPGCFLADDLNNSLGDPSEALLAAALFFRENASCPEVAAPAFAPAGEESVFLLNDFVPQPAYSLPKPIDGQSRIHF